MKKILSVIMSISLMMITLPCMAETENEKVSVHIEAEDYTRATFDVKVNDGTEFSNGKYLSLLSAPSAEEYKITYEFEAPIEGTYTLTLRANDVGVSWTSDYYLSVNDSEPQKITKIAQRTADVKTTAFSGIFKDYNAGAWDLNAGSNTLVIIVDKEDIRSELDGLLLYMSDYFDFTLSDKPLKGIYPSEDCGVYEVGSSVKYNVTLASAAKESCKYDYKVTDFWNRPVDSGSISFLSGQRIKNLSLGAYEIGWYKLELYNRNSNECIGYAHFSVVPKASERYAGDTPFAVDSGIGVLLKDDSMEEGFVRAAKLAGIKWARERGTWAYFRLSGNTDYSYITNRMDTYQKYGIKTTQILESGNLWSQNTYTDLFQAYEGQKKMAKDAEGLIDLMEIDNENDGFTGVLPGNVYSAYYKAMALGNADSGSNMKICMTSLCLDPSLTFTQELLNNEVLQWSDVYNIHAHSDDDAMNQTYGIRKKFLDNYNEAKMTANTQDIPNWLTEAGVYLNLENGETELSAEKYATQARYLATATIEALSTGVDKFFWFIFPKYTENGKELGTFDANFNPNPAYQAEAICSYMLGKGKYIGQKVENGINLYMFDNGNNDVMAAWTDSPQKYAVKSDKPVVVTDLMGYSKEVPSVDGYVNVDIAYYPVYITFDGKADIANYYPQEFGEDSAVKREFNAGERIILQQTFDQNLSDARNKGFLVSETEPTKMVLTVNNFNNEEKTIKINGQLLNFSVKTEQDTVTVPAMSKVDINVEIAPDKPIEFKGVDNFKAYLRFTAETDGYTSSPSVATIRVENNKEIPIAYPIDGAEDINNFDIYNVIEGAEVSSEVADDGSYRFFIKVNNKLGWYFPKIKVEDSSKLANSDGMTFWIRADEETAGEGDFKVFLNLSDGRRYYTGQDPKYSCSADWVQAKIAWDEVMLFTSPLGAVDIRPFDPELVESVEIGCNLYPGNAKKSKQFSFYMKDPGYYIADVEADANEDIVINEIVSDNKYSASDMDKITVKLPEGYSELRVMLTDEDIHDYTVENNELVVNLSKLSKGKYTLRIVIKDKEGIPKSSKVDFYIK